MTGPEFNPFEETDHDNRTCDHVKSVRQNETHICGLPAEHEHDGCFYCHKHFLIHSVGHFDEYNEHGDDEYGSWDETTTVDEDDSE
jgi:hypothetical protein